MGKKIVVLMVVIPLFVAGGVFWRQNQKDIRELNKNLPEGVKVVKSLFGFGREYKVANKIDDYEFKVPKEWKGLKEIQYYEEDDANGIALESLEGDFIGIGKYELKEINKSLETWIEEWMAKFEGLSWIREKEKIGDFEIIKLREEEHLAGELDYFFQQNSKIYSISGELDKFIREIILNGKW